MAARQTGRQRSFILGQGKGRVEMAGDSVEESIYEYAGGEDGIRKIVEIFYASIFDDPVLQPVFKQPVATHVDHLTAFLSEEFGGPARYTNELGGFEKIVAVHRHLRISEDQRQRFIDLFIAALEKAGFAGDSRFVATMKSAVEFGSEVARVNSNAKSDSELFPLKAIPHWQGEKG
jgi:hemoglobin